MNDPVYDFVNDRYIITGQSDGAGGVILGDVHLETKADYSGSLPLSINWVSTNTSSGDVNTGALSVVIPVVIAPVVDLPPVITLDVVSSSGLDGEKQPGGNAIIRLQSECRLFISLANQTELSESRHP